MRRRKSYWRTHNFYLLQFHIDNFIESFIKVQITHSIYAVLIEFFEMIVLKSLFWLRKGVYGFCVILWFEDFKYWAKILPGRVIVWFFISFKIEWVSTQLILKPERKIYLIATCTLMNKFYLLWLILHYLIDTFWNLLWAHRMWMIIKEEFYIV